MRSVEDYRKIVGDGAISSIYKKARKLYGKHIVNINSTYQGGGVAEMLSSIVPLMNEIGIEAGWRILHGNPDFFSITKKFHSALQGEKINLSEIKKKLYLRTNQDFSTFTHINHDIVIVHDPQPLPLVRFYSKRQPWIWRCHVDLSSPDEEIWDFIKEYILRYDLVIVSSEKYRKKDLPVEQRIISPAIDPLSSKNMEIPASMIKKYLKKYEIPFDKPIIAQVSRFDKWKDPEGVLKIFEIVRKKVDVRLILCGSMASDDPEAWKIYSKVEKRAEPFVKSGDVILITIENDILVNALQRISSVVIQKSKREGFGLTVAEALWKSRPVVASKVGGIPLQIEDGKGGYLVESQRPEEFAERVVEILKNPNLGETMGKNGRERIRKNFLITRLLSDYLDMLNYLYE